MANFAKGLTALGNRDDINVNVIHPGQTQTDRVEQLFAQFAKAQNKTVEQIREEALAKSGLRRIGQPEDVAALAVFLASAKGRHIQGTRDRRRWRRRRRGIIRSSVIPARAETREPESAYICERRLWIPGSRLARRRPGID